MRRLTIGVDLDGVTLDFNERYTSLYEAEFGTPVRRADEWDSLTAPSTHFITDDEFFDWFEGVGGWFDVPPVPGAYSGIEQLLTNGHRVYFVTSRKLSAAAGTADWLRRSPFPKIPLALNIPGSQKSMFPADVNIDDSPHVIENLRKRGRRVIVFDRPWNSEVSSTQLVSRAFDWSQVLIEVDRIALGEEAA